jgi:hypothetical protein
MGALCYRAGPQARARVRAAGLAGQVRVLVLPATGPKWLVAYGFDRALYESKILEGPVPTLLAGASAGAWRALSFASPDPLRMHERLMAAYCHQTFGRRDTPATVLRAYEQMLAHHFAGLEPTLIGGARFELAIHTVRARGARAQGRWHLASLGAAALLNPLSTRAHDWALERVTFHTPRAEALLHGIRTNRVPLTAENVLQAALASGSVPLAMDPVRNIAGAPPGTYLDGGMTDYHLAAPYAHDDGVTLLFSHQPHIVGRWLDQHLPWRRQPHARVTDRLVHVFPSAEFIAALPGGGVPSRDDFVALVDDPAERIRRWTQTAAASEQLGEVFLRDLATGRFMDELDA